MQQEKTLSFTASIITILAITVLIIGGVAILKIGVQSTFLLCIIATAIIAQLNKISIVKVHDYFILGCQKAVMIAMILMIVGTVIGTWMISGVVPAIIYYGLKLLTPSMLLSSGFLLCCITSFFTGSSYTCIATVGVALFGIAYGLSIPLALITGVIVSGAIFGDKLSPFSDTTILASGVAGADIFDHIKSMLYTTIPAFVLSLVLYFMMGASYNNGAADLSKIDVINQSILSTFTINPLLILVPVITVLLVVKKVPSIVALLIGALLGIVVAFIFQPQFGYKAILSSLYSGFSIDTGIAEVNKLLNRGGIKDMLGVVSTSMLALGFGEVLNRLGVLTVCLSRIDRCFNSPRKVVIGSIFSCLVVSALTVAQSVSIIVTGEAFKELYQKQNLAPKLLSRTLEDTGTIFAFLIPWSTSAIYVEGVLGIGAVDFVPYSFLAIACPILAILYAMVGFAQFKIEDEKPAISAGDR